MGVRESVMMINAECNANRPAESGRSPARRLIGGSAWNLAANASSRGATFIANLLVARSIGRVGFGQYAMIYSTLLTLTTIAESGLAYTVSKYVAEYRTSNPRYAGAVLFQCGLVCLGVASAAAMALYVAAPFLSSRLLQQPGLTLGLRIGAAFVLLSAASGFQAGALSGLESYRRLAGASIVSGILTVCCIGIGTTVGGGTGAVAGLTAGVLVRCGIQHSVLRRELAMFSIRVHLGRMRADWALLFRFALPTAISGYALMPVVWTANALMVRQPQGYSEMALYSAATNIRILVLFVPAAINVVGLAILNQIRGEGNATAYEQSARLNLAAMSAVAGLAAVAAAATGKQILRTYGAAFVAGYAPLLVLLVAAVAEAVQMAMFQRIQSQGRMWLSLFGIIVPSQAVFLAGAFAFVPRAGALGLAAAHLTGTLLMTGCTGLCVRATSAGPIGADHAMCRDYREEHSALPA